MQYHFLWLTISFCAFCALTGSAATDIPTKVTDGLAKKDTKMCKKGTLLSTTIRSKKGQWCLGSNDAVISNTIGTCLLNPAREKSDVIDFTGSQCYRNLLQDPNKSTAAQGNKYIKRVHDVMSAAASTSLGDLKQDDITTALYCFFTQVCGEKVEQPDVKLDERTFIFYDNAANKLYLYFWGIASLKPLVTIGGKFVPTKIVASDEKAEDKEMEANAKEQPLEGNIGRAHWGFNSYHNKAWPAIYKTIKPYLDKKPQIILVGHSMGGTQAILAALKLSALVPKDKISVITFGMPPFLSSAAAKNYDKLLGNRTVRIFVSGDPVPTFKSLRLLKYVHVGKPLLLAVNFSDDNKVNGWILHNRYYCFLEDLGSLEGCAEQDKDNFGYFFRIAARLDKLGSNP